MLAAKLAYRNLAGAGLRTWLTALVLSFSFVVIIWHKGLLEGWNRQARRDTIDWAIGGGQYWHPDYDPYDPFTIVDSHGPIPGPLVDGVQNGECAPVLISQAAAYPEGRMQNILLKGIDPAQTIVRLPSAMLDLTSEDVPAIIGTRMASNTGLRKGDSVTIRWRDANGTFDAAEANIVGIFKTNVPVVDNGQIWIPLERLRAMLQMPGEATLLISATDEGVAEDAGGWAAQGYDVLLAELDQIIRQKSVGGAILYFLLLALALLAIFDTQVLAVFRRQREIGTDIALGMTRGQVVTLFTFEGAMHGVLAAFIAAVYGIPLLSWQAKKGFGMPEGTDDYGLAIAERIFPAYSAGLVLTTTVLVLLATTVVSFIPARKIAQMNPTDAIRGKIQ